VGSVAPSRSTPSASYSITLRVHVPDHPDALARLLSTIARTGGMIGAIDLVRIAEGESVRDVTVSAHDLAHSRRITEAVAAMPEISVANVSDRTFLLHLGGKLEVRAKTPVRTRDDLSMAYTPGVARVCQAIAEDVERSFNLTIRSNTVAVISDGTAVLGLGNIGPEAAMPVMEGKAVLFKEFAGVDAFPICLREEDPDAIVAIVQALAPTFGGINLEDISSPRCFEIEERLDATLDIPVFHDDQHGTAVVVLAALYNALKITGRNVRDVRLVVSGIGAAGIACTRILLEAGVADVIGVDRRGIVHRGRTDLDPHKRRYAERTNAEGRNGDLADALPGADLFLGLSAPGLLTGEMLGRMNPDPIVFAMANPIPEIMPEEARGRVGVIATGRSDYPNQINNVLCFPGIFRGALEVRARQINEEMKLAAASAIANVIPEDEIRPDYVVPSVFDRRVAQAVASEVAAAAIATGVARRSRAEISLNEADVAY
jgi:malate dehydrogenase (oxaloacetate-decarboxylating)